MKLFITGFICSLMLMLGTAGGFYLWTLHAYNSCHFEYSQKIDAIEDQFGGFGIVMRMLESGTTDDIEALIRLKQQRDACRQYYWQ